MTGLLVLVVCAPYMRSFVVVTVVGRVKDQSLVFPLTVPAVIQVEPLQYWTVPPARLRPFETPQAFELDKVVSTEIRFTLTGEDQSYWMKAVPGLVPAVTQ